MDIVDEEYVPLSSHTYVNFMIILISITYYDYYDSNRDKHAIKVLYSQIALCTSLAIQMHCSTSSAGILPSCEQQMRICELLYRTANLITPELSSAVHTLPSLYF